MASPFVNDTKRKVYPGQVFVPVEKNTIKEWIVKEVVKKTGDGEEDFVIEKKVVLDKEYNRADYINSFANDVGLKNILKKVQLTGDTNLLIQRSDALNNGSEIYDFTQLPDDPIKAHKIVVDAVALFDSLPADMKKDMSYEEFVNKFDADAYVKGVVAANTPSAEKKEGNE